MIVNILIILGLVILWVCMFTGTIKLISLLADSDNPNSLIFMLITGWLLVPISFGLPIALGFLFVKF